MDASRLSLGYDSHVAAGEDSTADNSDHFGRNCMLFKIGDDILRIKRQLVYQLLWPAGRPQGEFGQAVVDISLENFATCLRGANRAPLQHAVRRTSLVA